VSTGDAVDLNRRLAEVKLLVLDVDGVLTDGTLYLDNQGNEFKRFSVRDGLGLVLAMRAGLEVAVISGRISKALSSRMKELGVKRIYQGIFNKKEIFTKLLSETGFKREETAVIGDDLPDLPLLIMAGVSVTVPEAADEVKEQADIVTRTPGGYGAVRELVEMILKASGQWNDCVRSWTG
jgi:3-deoxy-D-manno-octulosonate 8-phosphate phosphatase (KDO 8-P phosphatase)